MYTQWTAIRNISGTMYVVTTFDAVQYGKEGSAYFADGSKTIFGTIGAPSNLKQHGIKQSFFGEVTRSVTLHGKR